MRTSGSASTRLSNRSRITGPPWPCSSSTSSPVKEFGPGNHSAMP
ncbi:hypothetical protein BLA29_015080 [Euroglyphus maynei]|uniref:Uncharacterized protein n=1 Tax=Euroglyphus maynei TaxID=6958 RepID=A0A1Y3BB77_EURMA|nr:hypothetical protein BLA29_015080 [Euroglyphus maynei]